MTNIRFRNIIAITCLLFLHPGMVSAQEQKITLKVQRRQQAIPVSDVTSVGGFAGDRISKNKDNYLKVFPIEEHVKFLEDRNYKEWDWKKAEQPGKWIESSILTSKRT